ncbi:MAG: COP23 domain-containing protein [Xenococcaceae cyanobacterium]
MVAQKFLFTILSTNSLVVGAVVALCQPTLASQVSIACDNSDTIPKLVATTNKQNVTMLQFLSKYFSPQEALQNCKNTATKLQTLARADSANYLTSGLIEQQPVVCVVAQRGTSCNSNSAKILFSLNTRTEPIQAFYQMLGNDFKGSRLDNPRTVGRIYADIKPDWWRFWKLIK